MNELMLIGMDEWMVFNVVDFRPWYRWHYSTSPWGYKIQVSLHPLYIPKYLERHRIPLYRYTPVQRYWIYSPVVAYQAQSRHLNSYLTIVHLVVISYCNLDNPFYSKVALIWHIPLFCLRNILVLHVDFVSSNIKKSINEIILTACHGGNELL